MISQATHQLFLGKITMLMEIEIKLEEAVIKLMGVKIFLKVLKTLSMEK